MKYALLLCLALAGCSAAKPGGMLKSDGTLTDLPTFSSICSTNIQASRPDLTKERADVRCWCMYSLVKQRDAITSEVMDDAYRLCDAGAQSQAK